MMRIAVAGAALALPACTIADVTVAPGEDRLVVEGVLRTDARTQFILLHRGVQSGVAQGEPGAEVVVTRGDGLRITFHESALACYSIDPGYLDVDHPIEIRGTCYASPSLAGRWVIPGATYDLSIRSTRGEEARGRTVVPGTYTLKGVPVSRFDDQPPQPCTLAPATPLPLTWTQAAGAWGYIAPLQISGLRAALPDSIETPDPLELLGVSVSAADTSLVLPGEFGVFDRFSLNQDLLRVLQTGLPAGTSARVVVAAADRNYINGVRGGSFNPSGPVRISSVVGDAVGVFGSLEPLYATVVAGPPVNGRPFCGG
ncbi:MAG TPA: hypothetical protein VFT45_20315 [Longimicrobium sp.]|nr:hypothetical protein [Longimicrobium sp.]